MPGMFPQFVLEVNGQTTAEHEHTFCASFPQSEIGTSPSDQGFIFIYISGEGSLFAYGCPWLLQPSTHGKKKWYSKAHRLWTWKCILLEQQLFHKRLRMWLNDWLYQLWDCALDLLSHLQISITFFVADTCTAYIRSVLWPGWKISTFDFHLIKSRLWVAGKRKIPFLDHLRSNYHVTLGWPRLSTYDNRKLTHGSVCSPNITLWWLYPRKGGTEALMSSARRGEKAEKNHTTTYGNLQVIPDLHSTLTAKIPD